MLKKTVLLFSSFTIFFLPTIFISNEISKSYSSAYNSGEIEDIQVESNDSVESVDSKTITLGFTPKDTNGDGTIDFYNEYFDIPTGHIYFEDMLSIETLEGVQSYEVKYSSSPFSVTYWMSLSGLGDVVDKVFGGIGGDGLPGKVFSLTGKITSIIGGCVCFPVYTKDFESQQESMYSSVTSSSTNEVAYHYDVLNTEIGETLNYIFGGATLITDIVQGSSFHKNKFIKAYQIYGMISSYHDFLFGWKDLFANEYSYVSAPQDALNDVPEDTDDSSLGVDCPYSWINDEKTKYSSSLVEPFENDYRFGFSVNDQINYDVVQEVTFVVEGDFYYFELGNVAWNEIPFEDEIWDSYIFIPSFETTYSDIEEILLGLIKQYGLTFVSGETQHFEWVEGEAELVFVEPNKNVQNPDLSNPTDTNQWIPITNYEELIKTDQIYFYLESSDIEGDNSDDFEHMFFGQTPVCQVNIPYYDISFSSIEENKYYELSSMNYSTIQNPTNPEENLLYFQTNTPIAIDVADESMVSIIVDDPYNGRQTYDLNGDTHSNTIEINYEDDVYSDDNFIELNKMIDGKPYTTTILYNQKQQAELPKIALDNGTTIEPSVMASSQIGSSNFTNAVSLVNTFPTIEYNEDLVNFVNVKYLGDYDNFNSSEESSMYYPIENGQEIWEPIGAKQYGVYQIQTMDNFGNESIVYVEILEDNSSPKVFDQMYLQTAWGKAMTGFLGSVGYSPSQLQAMSADDLLYALNQTTSQFNLSTATFDVQSKISNEVDLGSITEFTTLSDLIPYIEDHIVSIIQEKNTQITKEDLIFEIQFIDGQSNESPVLGEKISILVKPVPTDFATSDEYTGTYGYYYEEVSVTTKQPVDLNSLDIDSESLSNRIGEIYTNELSFGNVQTLLNNAVVEEINSQTTPNDYFINTNDLEIEWYGWVEGSSQLTLLTEETKFEDITSNNFSYKIIPTNYKSENGYYGHVELQLYNVQAINTIDMDTLSNNFVVWKGTKFEDLVPYFEEEIYRELKQQLEFNPELDEPLNKSDIIYTFYVEDDYVLTNDVEQIGYRITINTNNYKGSLEGVIEINTSDKVNTISDKQLDQESMSEEYAYALTMVDEETILSDVKPYIESTIITELNETPSNAREVTEKLTSDDIEFVYSISDTESIYQEFDVSFKYKYDDSNTYQTLSFNPELPEEVYQVNSESKMYFTILTSTLITFGVVGAGATVYFVRRNKKKKKVGDK